MALPSNLATKFAKLVKKETPAKETTVYGTIVESDGKRYVQLDGSNLYTPVATTVGMTPGERVTVLIKNHTAIVTGNMTSPSARMVDVDDIEKTLGDLAGDFDEIANNMGTSEEGMLLLGNAETPVAIVGSDIYHYVTSSGAIYKPYYEAGDGFDLYWQGYGYIGNSKELMFGIPLSKPLIGNNVDVAISMINGIKVYETGAYCYGCSATAYVTPKTTTISLSGDGSYINVVMTFNSTSNATARYAAGIEASIRIDFISAEPELDEPGT